MLVWLTSSKFFMPNWTKFWVNSYFMTMAVERVVQKGWCCSWMEESEKWNVPSCSLLCLWPQSIPRYSCWIQISYILQGNAFGMSALFYVIPSENPVCLINLRNTLSCHLQWVLIGETGKRTLKVCAAFLNYCTAQTVT